MKKDLALIKSKVNEFGASFKQKELRYYCKDIFLKNNSIFCIIANDFTGFQFCRSYDSLLKNKNILKNSAKLIQRVNKWGSSLENKDQPYKFYKKEYIKSTSKQDSFFVQHKKTKKISIVRYSNLCGKSNPFRKTFLYQAETLVKTIINKLGSQVKNPDHKYVFVRDLGTFHTNPKENKSRFRKVLIQNIQSKEEKAVFFSALKQQHYNPFSDKTNYKELVNLWGMKSPNKSEHFLFVKVQGRFKNNLYFIIEKKDTKEKERISHAGLITGKNPFRNGASLENKYFHPQIKKELKKLGYHFLYDHPISRRDTGVNNRPDFIVIHPVSKLKMIIEAKHDLTSHGQDSKSTYRQLSRYHRAMSRDKFYRGSIILSTHGKNGYKISDLKKELKSLIGKIDK